MSFRPNELAQAIKFEDWQRDANCAGQISERWYSEEPDDIAWCKAICAGCNVREECYQHALDNHISIGIYGGLTYRQRRGRQERERMQRKRDAVDLSKPQRVGCGTDSGYHYHVRRHQAVCDPCRDAHNLYQLTLKRRRKAERETA